MQELKEFKRDFLDPIRKWTWIGSGSVGGKAQGLLSIQDILSTESVKGSFADTQVSIPSFTIIRTDIFDAFLERNNLYETAYGDLPDDVIAQAFQRASLPVEILGDLRSIVERIALPLAVRSSSLLEDALYQPFAGVYATKMIPNNQLSADERFQRLVEAVKLVYASTFSKSAKDYIRATGRNPKEEKMAVVIQEVVGTKFGERFYPEISGVARSYNFYAMGRARPEDGVVSLALGLGRTIVDGEICWTYSPALPAISPPFGSPSAMLKETQRQFWSVNMGKPPAYDPINEAEYLVQSDLSVAETDGTLTHLASTYDIQQDKVSMGIAAQGPRVLTFAGLLRDPGVSMNDVIRKLLLICEASVGKPVEIEFAITLHPYRIGFLQVRPMVVSDEDVVIAEEELVGERVLLASRATLGNGVADDIQDIIYVKPEMFETKFTNRIAMDIAEINRELLHQQRSYLLIGFGRWGSSDPWLGIPVTWGQVSGAKIIVEASVSSLNADVSQGSHFFHNLNSFKVSYFCIPPESEFTINWAWLRGRKSEHETEFVRHVTLVKPLQCKVDGKSGKGVVIIPASLKENI